MLQLGLLQTPQENNEAALKYNQMKEALVNRIEPDCCHKFKCIFIKNYS